MRRLFPASHETSDLDSRQWGLDELADVYAYPMDGPTDGPAAGSMAGSTGDLAGGPADRSRAEAGSESHRDRDTGWLRANMVSSLDGAAHHEGKSQPLSSDADMRIFGTLRGLADAVVVGAQTVRQEGYRPARAREAFAARRAALGQPPAPVIAVVSASLDLDFGLPLFTEPLVPTIVLTGAGAAPDRVAAARKAGAEVIVAGDSARVEPDRVKRVLAERGLTRLLTEGGPKMLGQFAAAGALDELCLSLAPMVAAGAAPRIMNGPGLAVPERFVLASVMEEAGFLFTRYRRI
ncbi:pyrimidine reductase family protein [Streptomyces sp. NPDC057654]|uniref:pyrimidine reductase family protein n=1 Tax=Streptomyces sp. NPDC057654 TaxID=3346196 RepID=UPI0036B89F26